MTNQNHTFQYQVQTEPVLPLPNATVSSWLRPFQEPVPRGRSPAYSAEFLAYAPQTAGEAIFVDKWFNPFSEPKRFPPRLDAASNPAAFMVLAEFGEAPDYSKFNYPWSEPVRFLRDPRASIALIASGDYYTVQPLAEDPQLKWFQPFSEPVRTKPGLEACLQQVEAYLSLSFFTQTPKYHGYIII